MLFCSVLKYFVTFLLTITQCQSTYALQDSIAARVPVPQTERKHTRVSLITVGRGEMIWEALGHACIRVIDSTQTGPFRDRVYNYGTFDISDDEFEKKMIEGTLLYYLSV